MSDEPTAADVDVAVVGGGPAGLTAALYTTRLGHDTVVVDRGGGRAAMMLDTHNAIGVTEDVSGNEFLATAVDQLEAYGTDYRRGLVTGIERLGEGHASGRRFHVETGSGAVRADRVVLATGFDDVRPDPPLPRTGRGLHYCLHCDAYMFVDEPVYVMGHGESAAHVAMILLNVTDGVDLLLRGDEPTWSEETDRQLRAHPVEVVESDVEAVERGGDGWLEALVFEDGARRLYRGGFAMYGSDYNDELAAELGCELSDDGTVAVDDHGRTSVDGVLAVGDLTPGHNQIPVAMGEGAEAGLAIHYDLRAFPRSLEAIEPGGPSTPTRSRPSRRASASTSGGRRPRTRPPGPTIEGRGGGTGGGTDTLPVDLAAPARVGFGAAGGRDLAAGWYAYSGSALGPGGFARVERHRELARGDRTVRNRHVDSLLGHPDARLTADVRSPVVAAECRVAEGSARTDGVDPVPGVGATDCGCDAHLCLAPDWGPLEAAARRAHDRPTG